MVESVLPGARAAVPALQTAPIAAPRKEYLNPDGSAVPDVIAYYNRPEDLGDMSDQTVPDATDSELFGKDGLTFGDLLDIINPLQHIPIISTIYRALTGDEISPGARLAGGALFGGPIGLGVAVVNAAVEASTGKDFGNTVLAAITGGAPAEPVATAAVAVAVAESDPAILAARTVPVSLLPLTQPAAAPKAQIAAPTSAPATASGATFTGVGLPFGGIGVLPFAAAPQSTNDPVAAILQARSAVPRAGPIAGLGGGAVDRIDRIDRTSLPAALPSISTRMSDRLAAFAARTTAPPAPPAPSKPDEKTKPGEANTAPATGPQLVPAGAVSQTMLNALDRYQQMKKAETAKLAG